MSPRPFTDTDLERFAGIWADQIAERLGWHENGRAKFIAKLAELIKNEKPSKIGTSGDGRAATILMDALKSVRPQAIAADWEAKVYMRIDWIVNEVHVRYGHDAAVVVYPVLHEISSGVNIEELVTAINRSNQSAWMVMNTARFWDELFAKDPATRAAFEEFNHADPKEWWKSKGCTDEALERMRPNGVAWRDHQASYPIMANHGWILLGASLC